MSENKKSVLKSVGSSLGSAAIVGGQMVLAKKANDVIIAGLHEAIGDLYPEEMKNNEIVKLIERLVMPTLIMSLVEMFPEMIPQADFVKRGTELAVQAAVFEAGIPLLEKMMPMLKELAKVGESVPAIAEVKDFEAEGARTRSGARAGRA